MKPSNDREAITLILEGMEERGCKVRQVADDTWNVEESTVDVENVAEAVDLIMGVDEAYAWVDLPDGDVSTWLFFVLGNDPEEVLCDYTVNGSEFIDPIVDPWWQ